MKNRGRNIRGILVILSPEVMHLCVLSEGEGTPQGLFRSQANVKQAKRATKRVFANSCTQLCAEEGKEGNRARVRFQSGYVIMR